MIKIKKNVVVVNQETGEAETQYVKYDTEASGIETETYISGELTENLHRTTGGEWFFSGVGGKYGDGGVELIDGNQDERAAQWLIDHVPASLLLTTYFADKIVEA